MTNKMTPERALELETINKLYLELSQIATAKTAREIELAAENERLKAELKRIIDEADFTAPELMVRIARKALESAIKDGNS